MQAMQNIESKTEPCPICKTPVSILFVGTQTTCPECNTQLRRDVPFFKSSATGFVFTAIRCGQSKVHPYELADGRKAIELVFVAKSDNQVYVFRIECNKIGLERLRAYANQLAVQQMITWEQSGQMLVEAEAEVFKANTQSNS